MISRYQILCLLLVLATVLLYRAMAVSKKKEKKKAREKIFEIRLVARRVIHHAEYNTRYEISGELNCENYYYIYCCTFSRATMTEGGRIIFSPHLFWWWH